MTIVEIAMTGVLMIEDEETIETEVAQGMTEVEAVQEMTEAAIVETEVTTVAKMKTTPETTGTVGECGNSNFSFRTECNRCGAPKGRGGRGPSKQWTGNDRRAGDRNESPQPRAGDWECRKCKKMNFAKRNECFSCRTPKRVGGPKRKGHHRSHRDPPPLHSAKYGRGRRDDR